MKTLSRLEAKGSAAPHSSLGAQRREALAIFAEIQKQLENDPDFLSARLITPEGGMIWRNRAAREFQGRFGFFPSPTLPWSGFKTYLTPEALAGLEAACQAAFWSGDRVDHELVCAPSGQAPQAIQTQLVSVCGNMETGVIAMCQYPLAADVAMPGAA